MGQVNQPRQGQPLGVVAVRRVMTHPPALQQPMTTSKSHLLENDHCIVDFIDVEQEGQVQQVIDGQPPKRLLYSDDIGYRVDGGKRTNVIIGASEGICKIYGKK